MKPLKNPLSVLLVASFVLFTFHKLDPYNNTATNNNERYLSSYLRAAVSNTEGNIGSQGRSSNSSQQKTDDNKLQQYYYDKYNYTQPGRIIPAVECGTSPDFDDFFQLSAKLRSRFQEDKIIYEKFFKHKHNNSQQQGTYVELGAFDGQEESNTRFFDLCLGWKGLLIEGNPITYEKTLKTRPYAHKMSFAPSCKDGSNNKTVPFYKYPMANSGLEGLAKTYEGKPMVDVPCGPLGPVLEDVFQGHASINFFSLDVEGAEPLVLETIDFNRTKIDVLMIEVQNQHCKKVCESRDRTRAIMQQAGYIRYEGIVQASDIYVHPESEFQMIA